MLSKAEEQLLLLFELELTDDFSQDGLLLAPVAPGSFIQSTADWHFVGSAGFYLLNGHSPFLSRLKSLIEHPLGEMCVRDKTWYIQESFCFVDMSCVADRQGSRWVSYLTSSVTERLEQKSKLSIKNMYDSSFPFHYCLEWR